MICFQVTVILIKNFYLKIIFIYIKKTISYLRIKVKQYSFEFYLELFVIMELLGYSLRFFLFLQCIFCKFEHKVYTFPNSLKSNSFKCNQRSFLIESTNVLILRLYLCFKNITSSKPDFRILNIQTHEKNIFC